MATTKTTYVCSECRDAKPGDRLPRGWKNVATVAMCGDCFRKRYTVRAVTLPVSMPADGRTWEELRPTLRDCWRLSTDLANWCVTSLFRIDTPGEPRCPDVVNNWYGYGEAKSHYPRFDAFAGAKQSLNIVARGVHREYVRRRFDVQVRRNQSLLTFRYPYPFPVDADAWSLSYEDGEFPRVDLGLPGIGSVGLVLRRRADFGRQLAMFRQLVSGEAIKGEAAIYEKRKSGEVTTLVKLVGWFPKRPPGERVHACFLHTDPNAFMVAEIDGRSPWILNADHLKRATNAHKTYLQRSGEDAKREKRMDRRQRSYLNKSRELRCEKHDNRMDTAVKQLSAQVARFIERQKVAVVTYDDRDKTYIPDGFRWYAVKQRIKVLCGEMGVQFIADDDDTDDANGGGGDGPVSPASGGVVTGKPGTARNDGGDGATKTRAPAKPSRNGRPGQSTRNRSRNAVKTGPGDGLKPTAPERPT